ncbi:MAG: glycosyltransferase family 2 protein [bacterium]|nr:glycosyltransferase family 2 protein [bacterium]
MVIVNWNAGSSLRECVDSVAACSAGRVDTIVVVDNGSRDGSADELEGRPDVKVVRAGRNLGFGRACNLGAREAGSEYLLFLNPDAMLRPATLPAVLAYMDGSAAGDVGICGVQLLDANGRVARSCSRLPTTGRLLAQTVGIDRFVPRLGCFMSEWDHAETREVQQVIGAFYLVRRPLFARLGGFDERFFVYFEEVDFALRAARAGWRSVYFTDAQAFHAGCGTTAQAKARRLFYYQRSRWLYARKHLPTAGAGAVLALTLTAEPFARTVGGLARARWPEVREAWGAWSKLLSWLGRGSPVGVDE